MPESIKIHIVIDQTETLEPETHCYISDPEQQTNYRTNINQIDTILTLQELLKNNIQKTRSTIDHITAKLGLHRPTQLYKLQNLPIEVFYYLDADGGNEYLSSVVEGINTRVTQNHGHIYSFTGAYSCGSAGFAFFSGGRNHTRYHSYHSKAGISLNMLESYFISQQDELETEFEHFEEMQKIINKKKNKIQEVIIGSSSLEITTPLKQELDQQMGQKDNHHQQVILNSQQLSEFQISTMHPNHYENLFTHLNPSELELTLCIQRVYDFLNSQSITYH